VMSAALLQHEAWFRLSVFVGGLLLLALLERLIPRRRRLPYWPRWAHNLALSAVSTLALRLAIPLAASAFAAIIAALGIGLFNRLSWPFWIEALISIAALDAAIYGQHRLMHRYAWLWRLHRVHHSDTGFDVSLAVRFHPFEMVLSMVYKLAVIAALGAAPVVVAVYESLLLAFALWTHGNIALPAGIDQALRRCLVTPEMHRIHHSVVRAETDSNYGNILSLWDRLFGSYVNQAKGAPADMLIGLDQFRPPAEQRLTALLAQPFRRAPDRS